MAYPNRTCYIVVFEVSPLGRPKLVELLKAYGTFCPITEHSWAIVAQQTAAEIRDYLSQALGQADRIFVIRSGTEAAWRNSFGEKHNEWLKRHL